MYNRVIFFVAMVVAIIISLWLNATKFQMFMLMFIVWNSLTIQDLAKQWTDKNKKQ